MTYTYITHSNPTFEFLLDTLLNPIIRNHGAATLIDLNKLLQARSSQKNVHKCLGVSGGNRSICRMTSLPGINRKLTGSLWKTARHWCCRYISCSQTYSILGALAESRYSKGTLCQILSPNCEMLRTSVTPWLLTTPQKMGVGDMSAARMLGKRGRVAGCDHKGTNYLPIGPNTGQWESPQVCTRDGQWNGTSMGGGRPFASHSNWMVLTQY